MKLRHITFTGIDGKTDIGILQKIQQLYPFAEFGVLVSKNWRENGNRYFNPSFLKAILNSELNLSAHLCGSIARSAISGDIMPFIEWTNGCANIFDRCQINISKNEENPKCFEPDETIKQLFDEIILQQPSADNCNLYLESHKKNDQITVLLDASGGEGIDTPIKVLSGDKIGYAGGINPDNVADKLSFLLQNENVSDFWIDMESGVRTDDWFDIDKVVKVLQICDDVVKKD